VLLELFAESDNNTTQTPQAQDPLAGTDPASETLSFIKDDLTFVVPLLKKWPKCYWIWDHRIWLLQQATAKLATQTARRLWQEELALCSMMLVRDNRNFHGWGYRRMIVAHLESPDLEGRSLAEDEFAYTARLVHANMSNFSAWHARSKLIPRVLAEREASDEERRKFLEDGELCSDLFIGPMRWSRRQR
jgi:geranylgeranyl transferase type-2 subunit alpha